MIIFGFSDRESPSKRLGTLRFVYSHLSAIGISPTLARLRDGGDSGHQITCKQDCRWDQEVDPIDISCFPTHGEGADTGHSDSHQCSSGVENRASAAAVRDHAVRTPTVVRCRMATDQTTGDSEILVQWKAEYIHGGAYWSAHGIPNDRHRAYRSRRIARWC